VAAALALIPPTPGIGGESPWVIVREEVVW
jgi:hypothetical protein